MRKLTEADLDRAQRWRASPLITTNGGGRIDTELLLASDAIQGPYRRPRPFTVTWRMRVSRALRSLALTLRSPL
jgi:hypothetical protein